MALLISGSALLWALLGTATARPAVVTPIQQRQATVEEIKAAFLYNFTRFVTWPSGIPPGSEPFRVCIVADRETREAVERTMAGEAVHGRPAETRVPRAPDEVRRCQLLFVGRDAEDSSQPLLQAARNLPVLVVGDGEQFPERGGAIGFVVENGRLRFDIRARNAEKTGLTISSRLLSVARRTDQDRR